MTPTPQPSAAHPDDRARPGQQSVPLPLLLTVVLLGAVGPLATDMYVPGFPHVVADLETSVTSVQLTLTAFFFGNGIGQLCGGPISDQLGRRRTLQVGTMAMLLASIGCALAPSIGVLLACRFVQGFGGGWAMVIGRAVLVDIVHGSQLVRIMNLLMGIGGVAPIVAPLLGGVVQQAWGWRAAFWLLAGIGVLMTVCALLAVPETLPPERRHGGGLAEFGRGALDLAKRRPYVGYVLVNAFSSVALFAYVATSSFVLQTMNGLSPTQYSLAFAGNAVGLMSATLLSARLAGRVPTRRVILVGQTLQLLAGCGLLAGALFFGTPLVPSMVCFFTLVTAQGLIGANGAALAAAEAPDRAGTASALLGLVQSVAASAAAPLAGLGGGSSSLPLAVLVLVGALGSMTSLLVVARGAGHGSGHAASPGHDVRGAS